MTAPSENAVSENAVLEALKALPPAAHAPLARLFLALAGYCEAREKRNIGFFKEVEAIRLEGRRRESLVAEGLDAGEPMAELAERLYRTEFISLEATKIIAQMHRRRRPEEARARRDETIKELMYQGLTNHAIAEHVGLHEKTVARLITKHRREKTIMELMYQGLTNHAIAERVGLHEKSVARLLTKYRRERRKVARGSTGAQGAVRGARCGPQAPPEPGAW